jgi:hypothetical protein
MPKFIVFIVFTFLFLTNVLAQNYPMVTAPKKDAEVPKVEKPKKKFEEYYIGDYKFKERNNYFLFGTGPTFYPNFKNFVNSNLSLDFHFFDKKDRQWVIGYQSQSQEYLIFGGASIYLNTFKFGRTAYRIEKQYWKFVGVIAPTFDFASYYPADTLKTFTGKTTYGVGIQIQPEFIFKPIYDFGIALSPFVNFNTVQTVAGITISVYGSNALVKKMR